MLILQRKEGESLRIGSDIEITVTAIEGTRVRLAINAPNEVVILRSELCKEAADTNHEAASASPENLVSFIKEIGEL